MDLDGLWRNALGGDDFRREGGWVHGPLGAWRELDVPGARDVTLEQLHGHRILDPRVDATLSKRYWNLQGDVLHFRLADIHEFEELSWVPTDARQRHDSLGTLCAFLATEWERRRATVVGMWAPELVRGDLRGSVAAAGLDERAAARDARSATGYRQALLRRGSAQLGLSHRTLAAAVGVSRGRVDQIIREPGQYGATAAASVGPDEIFAQLALAARRHQLTRERLNHARLARAAVVRQARREGLSLGQISDCLGVSRGRVQQVARRRPR
jgi:hypothetical protein